MFVGKTNNPEEHADSSDSERQTGLCKGIQREMVAGKEG